MNSTVKVNLLSELYNFIVEDANDNGAAAGILLNALNNTQITPMMWAIKIKDKNVINFILSKDTVQVFVLTGGSDVAYAEDAKRVNHLQYAVWLFPGLEYIRTMLDISFGIFPFPDSIHALTDIIATLPSLALDRKTRVCLERQFRPQKPKRTCYAARDP